MSEEVAEKLETPAKNAFLSKGVIGGVLATISGIVMLLGVAFTAEDAKNIGDMVDMIIEKSFAISAAVGGILAVIGRVKADTKVKFPWKKG